MLDWPDTATHGARFSGLYAATVEAVRRDGRLQVSVPAVYDLTAPDAQTLARPCLPYGHFFVPPVGAKVWIAFENGDPTAPVWIGTWFPQGTVPPEADADPPVKRVVKTAAGQLVVIDDTQGSEQVVLADKSGNRIELRTNGVLIKCAQNLTIDASGMQVEIKAAKVTVTEA
jgi:Type VI secretion system/phage-baseplate injector OB domain